MIYAASRMMGEEADRLDELRRYELFRGDDGALVRLAQLGAATTATPLCVINLVGATHQETVARWGAIDDYPPPNLPLESSLCRVTIAERDLLVADDLCADPRFAGFPQVVEPPHLRFYAGATLRTPLGLAIGTLCVFDRAPRQLSEGQRRAFAMLRDEVMQLFETRRELAELRRSESLRQEAVEALMATQRDLQARIDLRTREVEEAHKKTRQLLERIGDAFVALDRNWNYVYANARAAELFGRTPAELIGKHIWTEFPEGRGQPFHLAYERAMRDQVQITLEARYEPWDRWFENRIYPSPDGIAIFFTEITERRRAEEALEKHRARLIEAQRVAHVGSWEWDVATNEVVWSDELYRIYGLELGSALGGYEGFLSRVHPDDHELTKRVIGGVMAAPAPFVYDHRIVRPDGSVRLLHTRGEAVVAGDKLARLVGSCWDVTEQQETKQRAARTLALLGATMEVARDALLMVEAGGDVAAFNEHFRALFAVPVELPDPRAPARLWGWLAERVTAPAGFVEQLRTGGGGGVAREVVRLADGRELEAESRAQNVDGVLAGRVWSFRQRPTA